MLATMRSLLLSLIRRDPNRCGFCGLPDIHKEEYFCSEECDNAFEQWRKS